jgi:hypothetical protein
VSQALLTEGVRPGGGAGGGGGGGGGGGASPGAPPGLDPEVGVRGLLAGCLALAPTPLDAAVAVALGPSALAFSVWLGAGADVSAVARGMLPSSGVRDSVLGGVSAAVAAASMALAITLSNAYQVGCCVMWRWWWNVVRGCVYSC